MQTFLDDVKEKRSSGEVDALMVMQEGRDRFSRYVQLVWVKAKLIG